MDTYDNYPTPPTCSVHPETRLVCPRCNAAKGGRSRSKAKRKAGKANARKARKARAGA